MANEKNYLPLLDIDGILPILNKIAIFAGLSDKQLHSLVGLLEQVSYKKGQIIFEQGGEPSHIYIIQSGKIKLLVTEDQTSLELIVFDEGHCFGESSVIGIQPHAATAIAAEDTELIVLSRKALLSVYKTDIELFSILILNIAREACRRLHESDEILLHYVIKQ
jgi:CRP-like cAMP-binding protein